MSKSVCELRERFLALHHGDEPLVMPNPWDIGSARILESLGFSALATTSAGFAATLGRLDGCVTREEALSHGRHIAEAVAVPVSADLENGFADDPDEVARTVGLAALGPLAGCSIEDYNGTHLYGPSFAADRVLAAVEAAADGLVVTARAENHIRGNPDLADTIARLQRYQEAGAHVLYAPGLTRAEDIKALIDSVDRPVNVLLLPGSPSVPELARLGVSRVSIGGALANASIGALVEAAHELRREGVHSFWQRASDGRSAFRAAVRAAGSTD